MNTDDKLLSFQNGVHCLERGGVIIYPTETFYAVGCKVHSYIGLTDLYSAKKRPQARPIPVLAANMEQVDKIAILTSMEQKLAEQFWPGPLTILASVRASVPKVVVAGTGRIALRISSHTLATDLAKATGDALVCSSANISGEPPVADYKELSSQLVNRVQGIVPSESVLQGGLASTIVEVVGEGELFLRRAGAISIDQLMNAGWEILDDVK